MTRAKEQTSESKVKSKGNFWQRTSLAVLAAIGLKARADAQTSSEIPDLTGFVDSGGVTDLQNILMQADGSAQLVLTDGTSLLLSAAEVQVVNGQIFVSQAALSAAGVSVGTGGAALLTGATLVGGGAAAAGAAAAASGDDTPPNEGPAFTSVEAVSVSENETVAYTVTASDPENDTISYSISGGDDAAQFEINSSTGQVSFLTAPDFEAPGDGDGDNVYVVEVSASDGTNTTTQTIEISVTAENDNDPVFTSSDSATVEENTTAVSTVAATDADGDEVSYQISGGADAALFVIDVATGTLSFLNAPDFEAPADDDGDNVYQIEVTASDGDRTSVQTLSITVTDVDENPPVFSSDTEVEIGENQTDAYTAEAIDAEGGTVSYAIVGGADASLFGIDEETGAVSFNAAPDFESPTDADASNVYEIEVSASDGANTSTQTVSISVTNLNDNAPIVTSSDTAEAAENQTSAFTASGTDADGDDVNYSISGGADASLFAIDTVSGDVTFLSAPDFETPGDDDGDNVYEVEISASDGTLSTTQIVQVTVTNENDNDPAFTSGTSSSVEENTTDAYTATATDADGETPTFSISGGDDAALFDIDSTTGAVSFVAAPDFENPGDDDGDNVYEVEVTASDGTRTSAQTIAVTVTNSNDNDPAFTSGAFASINENETAAYNATATDADGATPIFSISGGADAALFDINETTGAVSFISAPDFETPGDDGTNNVYEVEVSASDGTRTVSQTVSITVTNTNDNLPVFSSGTSSTVAENVTGAVYTAAATDADGTTPTFSLSGTDSALFNINGTTGEVSFIAAPDFESPGDDGGNNVYDIIITASNDGGTTVNQAVTITVNNENDNDPVFTSATTASMAENQTAAYTATATDADGATPTFSMTGGADADLFDINETTGVISFKTTPDFETPGDDGTDNVYDVEVTASDGTRTAVQTVSITVTDVNDNAPDLSAPTSTSVDENTTDAVFTASAMDDDTIGTLVYSLSGTDADAFEIDSGTGEVTFASPPDFETPTDDDTDNTYEFTVNVTDGVQGDSVNVSVSVNDLTEGPELSSFSMTGAPYDYLYFNFVDGVTVDPDRTDSRISYFQAISDDGQVVAFSSTATTGFAEGSNSGYWQTYIKDYSTGDITPISVTPDGSFGNSGSYLAEISGNGRYVFYSSIATNLDADQNGGGYDIFRHDLETGTTILVSSAADGTAGNSHNYYPKASDDGRYVTFWSNSNNLSSSDTSTDNDLYVKDIDTGAITLVTKNADGNNIASQGYLGSEYSISGDGNYIVYTVREGQVSTDTNGRWDVYLYDRVNDTNTLISTNLNGGVSGYDSRMASISDDGRYVVFGSLAPDLVENDGTDWDVFLYDTSDGSLQIIGSPEDSAHTLYPEISGDGNTVAFYSRSSSLADVGNGQYQVYTWDRESGEFTIVSRTPDGGLGNSSAPLYDIDLSDTGQFLVFDSYANNLVPNDAGNGDIFRADLDQIPDIPNLVRPIEFSIAGTYAGEDSLSLEIDWDGDDSIDETIALGVGETSASVFREFDQGTDTTVTIGLVDESGIGFSEAVNVQTAEDGDDITLVSSDVDGAQGNSSSQESSVSGNGRYVVFESSSSNLDPDDTENRSDIFREDLQTGEIQLVSSTTAGGNTSGYAYLESGTTISDDGRYVVFRSNDTGLLGVSGTQVYRKDMETGTLELVSETSDGTAGNNTSQYATISGNGRYVAFSSYSTNLSGDDTDFRYDIYRKDMQTGELILVSVNSDGNALSVYDAFDTAISTDGRYVVFYSRDSFVSADTNGNYDIYIRDVQEGTTRLVSSTSDGVAGNGAGFVPSVSADGNLVAFASNSSNFDGSSTTDVFVKNLSSGELTLVSAGLDGNGGNSTSDQPDISADGRYVVYRSAASNLVDVDNNGQWDVFRYDMQTGETIRISEGDDSSFFGNDGANGYSYDPSISDDGQIISFHSGATNLVDGGSSGQQVFVRDLSDETAADFTGTDGRDILIGEDLADTLSGAAGEDVLRGDRGDDTIDGGAGNDEIEGGFGADNLTGGADADRFVYLQPSEGGDTITDFTPSEDKIVVNPGLFEGGLEEGEPVQLVSASEPVAENEGGTFLYNTDTGELFWDEDGTGTGGAVLLATLTGAPSISASDIEVIGQEVEEVPLLLSELSVIFQSEENGQAPSNGAELAGPEAPLEDDMDQETILVDQGDGWA